MPFKLALIAVGLAAVGATATAAHASEPTRTVCLNGQKTIEVIPDNENTIGEPYTNGPCPTTTSAAPTTTKPGTPTTVPPTVTLCIQGHTTTGPKGAANPNGYPYYEGPCDTPTVKAVPHFTG